jgi:hypothetical protein
VKGQLAGVQVTADGQTVPRGGGGKPGPGVSAVALGALPAERISQRLVSFRSIFAASAQVAFVPAASVSMKDDATLSTYAWPRPSRSSRSCVQLP